MDVDDADVEKYEFRCTIALEQETAYATLALNSGSQKLLKCPDTWISDTGATQHSMFSSLGCINKWECNVRTKGQMGTATITSIVMDFYVKLWNILRYCDGNAVRKDVQMNSKFNYNLISINWLLKDGFTLSDNSGILALVHTSDKQFMIQQVHGY